MKTRKCSTCKRALFLDEFKVTKAGKIRKTCKSCLERSKTNREKTKCQQGKRRSQCKVCGGRQICQHGRERSTCKDYLGASICKHGKRRLRCRDCGGSQICEHSKIRSLFKDCDPSEHLAHVIRSPVISALKNDKEFSSQKYQDCDIKTFKEHIEQ